MKTRILIDTRVKISHPNRGISNNLNLYLSALNDQEVIHEVEQFTGFLGKFKTSGLLGFLFYVIDEQLFLPIYSLLFKYDYVLFPNQTAPILPINSTRILLVHDVMFFENITKYGIRGRMFASSIYRSMCMLVISHLYNIKFITISASAKKEIIGVLGLSEAKVSVIPCALNRTFCNSDNTIDTAKGYIFTVSGEADHKNFSRLRQAINEIDDPSINLSAVGIAAIVGDEDRKIRYFNNISNLQMDELYRSCDIFVFASINEGFGIPLLEAMHFGKVICCSDIPVFREIMGDDALYFDPYSVDELKNTLLEAYRRKDQVVNYKNRLQRFEKSQIIKQIRTYFSNL